MKPSRKSLRLALVGLIVLAVVLVAVIVGPIKRVGEFGRAESVKGYWASLQDFVKQNGHYPKGDAEIAAFFHTAPEKEPVEYVAPHDDSADEVVLWWKQKTMFDVKVGVTESGMIVKR
jgi:hypothetical protein